MSNLISINTYNINKDLIPEDLLLKYTCEISNLQKTAILKNYKSVEDYVYILYYFKFVKRYTNSEMAKITGKKLFYSEYYKFGWHYPIYNLNDIEKHHEKEITRINTIRDKAINFDDNELPPGFLEFYESNETNFSKTMILNSGFRDKKTFAKVLYYLFEVEKISTTDLATVFKISRPTIHLRLKKFGLKRSTFEAQQLASKLGKRDYRRILPAGAKTREKSKIKTGLTGSSIENSCRTNMEMLLPRFFNLDVYEIVIGINCKSVIHPYELDIPMIVINKNTQRVTKIAIEFDGAFFHSSTYKKRIDRMKKEILKKHGWEYFNITALSSTKLQREYGLIEEQIRDIYQQVLEII